MATFALTRSSGWSVEIQHLRGFILVATLKNVSKAALHLNMAQPTLSRQISVLERDIGAALFIRRDSMMTLTDEGEIFFPVAQNLVNEMDLGLLAVRNLPTGQKTIRIGYIPAYMYAFLANAILTYQKANPAVEIEFTNASPAAQVKLLELRQIDIACMTRMRSDLYSMERVAQVPLIYALPRDGSMSQQHISLKQFRKSRFLIPDKREYPLEEIMVRRVCKIAGFEPRIRELDGMDSVLAAIGIGAGIAIIPAHFSLLPCPTVRWENLSFGATESPFTMPTSDVCVVTRDLHRAPHLQQCIDAIKVAAKNRYETRFWQQGSLASERVMQQPDRRRSNRRAIL